MDSYTQMLSMEVEEDYEELGGMQAVSEAPVEVVEEIQDLDTDTDNLLEVVVDDQI
jgi:hypothetical protein